MDPSRPSQNGACAGIRILDFTAVISGPMCTQILGDLGADVIKVEPPSGEANRYSGAPFREPGFSGMIAQFNRNKRSLVVDLKSDEGRELILSLVPKFDVVAENYRPHVMESLGLGWETLRARHPGLIYLAINGFGSDGPYAELPAYDMVMQGLVGLMPQQGGDGPPRLVQGSVADKSTSMTAVSAVLAALLARERDPEGRGQRVEVAMIDAYAAFALPEAMVSRSFPPLEGNPGSGADFFRCWETADGHVVGVIIQDSQFAGLCRALDRPDLARDARFETMGPRFQNYGELVPLLAEEIRRHPSKRLVERARAEGAPFAPVNDVEAFLADPHVRHRGSVRELEDPRFGTTRYLAPPIRMERTPTAIERHPPRLGEHTVEVLSELGIDDREIERLLGKGTIHGTRGED
jgi:crotonobetainyl-CoA:carnitine CoA-transferase CaiB-like acyl-CoA transferase